MTSVYRSEQARAEVRRWCVNRIDGSGLARARSEVVTSAGGTGVVTAGPEPREGEPSVALLPGTNMNAALCLPVAEAIARERRVVVLDLPGQPGLSADGRPRAKRSSWYGKWLTEALARAAPGPVVVVGHSLGGAVALACDAPQIVGRVLLSSAGDSPAEGARPSSGRHGPLAPAAHGRPFGCFGASHGGSGARACARRPGGVDGPCRTLLPYQPRSASPSVRPARTAALRAHVGRRWTVRPLSAATGPGSGRPASARCGVQGDRGGGASSVGRVAGGGPRRDPGVLRGRRGGSMSRAGLSTRRPAG